MVLTIVMWTYCDTFKTPECNTAIQFVFFFAVQVPAVKTGRVVALVFAYLAMVVYTVLTFTECWAWWRHGRSLLYLSQQEVRHDIETAHTTGDRPRRGSVSTPRGGHFRHGRRRHRYYQQRWLVTNVDRKVFSIQTCPSLTRKNYSNIFGHYVVPDHRLRVLYLYDRAYHLEKQRNCRCAEIL